MAMHRPLTLPLPRYADRPIQCPGIKPVSSAFILTMRKNLFSLFTSFGKIIDGKSVEGIINFPFCVILLHLRQCDKASRKVLSVVMYFLSENGLTSCLFMLFMYWPTIGPNYEKGTSRAPDLSVVFLPHDKRRRHELLWSSDF